MSEDIDNRTVSLAELPVTPFCEDSKYVNPPDGPAMRVDGRWLPGKSGNPTGRPKVKPITDALRQELTPEKCRKIAKAMVEKMVKASVPHFNEVANRVEGRVQDSEGSGSIIVQVVMDIPRPHGDAD